MKNIWIGSFCLILSLSVKAQTDTKQILSSSKADTWVATDDLKRELSVGTQNGEIRKDKYVGIFYFIWQGAHGYDKADKPNADESVKEKKTTDTQSPYDITQLLKENPKNPKYGPIHAFHHWGEPYFGYYLPDDEWIIRKHAQMLSDAQVDVIILDVTNASIYLPQVTKIANIYREMRKEGLSTPSFAFIVNSNPNKTVSRLYENIYKPGLFKDLWFYWKGKPLLLTPPEGLSDDNRDFFNAKHSWAWSKGQKWFGDGKDKWPWLDHTPQNYGWHESKDVPEAISVAIAEHPMSNIGRSFHDGKEPEVKQSDKGFYFNEQWKRALEVDPEFVFVTGWNEWVAMRFDDGRAANFLGNKIEKGETYFVDLYNAEFSRDSEPVKGDFNDNYYYQLVNNIRKFKGSREIPTYTAINKINIDGSFKDWEKVNAVFKDDIGDTLHRDHPGFGRIEKYTNFSGRNDIIESKVASDDNYIYFYVKTNQKLSSYKDKNWMNLWIGLQNQDTNWEGFQYQVNSKVVNDHSTTLNKYSQNKKWVKIDNDIKYKAAEREIEIAVPKKLLSLSEKDFTIDFKWTDNIEPGNPMLWLDQGDAAPNARFKYRYIYKENK